MLLRRHQACRLCMSKALSSVPAVSEDWPPLCRYSAALGNAGGGYNGLRAADSRVQIPCTLSDNNAGVGCCGHRAYELLHGDRGAAIFGSANATCSSISLRAPLWRVTRIIRLCTDVMLRSR